MAKGAAQIVTLPAAHTHALRRAVLWPDRPLEAQGVEGDDTALHLGALEGEGVIGVASFFPDGPRVRLRKLAVDPARQGQGIGAALLRAGAARLRADGCTALWCDARVTALGFYERLGFAVAGPIFDKSGVAYRVATLDLRRPD